MSKTASARKFQFSLKHLLGAIAVLSLISWAVFKPDTYPKEEVASSYGYPTDYKIKSIGEQVAILRQYFPNLGSVDEQFAEHPLPVGAEGYFAIPRWEKIAPTYPQAVEKVLAAIKQARTGNFFISCESMLGPQYLRETPRAARFWAKLGREQESHDIIVVPAQFGLLHRGRSVRRACALMTPSEFGLGTFAVGCMLLTHPERLKDFNDLFICCAGDQYEYSIGAYGVFSWAPFFLYTGGVRCSDSGVSNAERRCGSASAFLPAEAR